MQRFAVLLLALTAVPALGQDGGAAPADPAMGSVAPLYRQMRDFITAAAEQMPEGEYGFRPTPEVRSFGQVVGHIANVQFIACTTALGEANPNPANLEETTDRAALIEGLRASSAVCDRAYAQTDAQAMGMTTLFGRERTRFSVLVLNVTHDFEHYGNLVTYLRLRGMVPPSSQGG